MAKKKESGSDKSYTSSGYNYGYGKGDDRNRTLKFRAKESYKALRTNIRFLTVGSQHSRLAFTSSDAGEGKSTTIINIAITMKEAGAKVLLIDGDLRRPSIHRMANLPIIPGLTNYLSGSSAVDDVIRHSKYPGLDIVTSGAIPPNPAELLGSSAMASFMDEVSKRYDYVLCDTPPVTVVSDAMVLSPMVDGFIFVVRAGSTDADTFRKGIEAFTLVDAKILGLVLNDVADESSSYYRKGYYRRKNYGGYYKNRYSYYYYSQSHRQSAEYAEKQGAEKPLPESDEGMREGK